MNQILCCDWLPERARWSNLARLRLPAVSCKKKSPKAIACSVKMAGYWPHSFFIGVFLFCEWLNTQKKEHGQYPAILTSHLLNDPYILTEQALSIKALLYCFWGNFSLQDLVSSPRQTKYLA